MPSNDQSALAKLAELLQDAFANAPHEADCETHNRDTPMDTWSCTCDQRALAVAAWLEARGVSAESTLRQENADLRQMYGAAVLRLQALGDGSLPFSNRWPPLRFVRRPHRLSQDLFMLLSAGSRLVGTEPPALPSEPSEAAITAAWGRIYTALDGLWDGDGPSEIIAELWHETTVHALRAAYAAERAAIPELKP